MIKAVSENEIVYARKRGQTDVDIRQFMESNDKCCEVVDDNVSPASLYYRYFQAVKRIGHPIRVVRRGGRIFMIKENI